MAEGAGGAPESSWAVPISSWSDEGSVAHGRGRTTRHALLLAAAREFDAHGYHGTSLTEILTGSGRTKGALYFHFESKRDLAEALADEAEASWRVVHDRIAERHRDPLTTLLLETDAYVGRWSYDPVVRGISRALPGTTLFAERQRAWYLDWERDTAEHLTAARDAGILRAGVDPTGMSRAVVAVSAGHRSFAEILPDGPDLFVRMSDTWRGLLPPIVTSDWLAGWRASTWDERRGPDPAAHWRAREP